MLKAAGRDKNGQPILLFGLSGENVTRLAAGEPIGFNLTDMGLPPCQVMIVYGKTEEEILDNLRRELAGQMRIHVKPRTPVDDHAPRDG